MNTIHLNTTTEYDIFIGGGILGGCGDILRRYSSAGRAVVVTDDVVSGLYGDRVLHSLAKSGFDCDMFVFANGESSKTHRTLTELYDFLCGRQFTRKDLLVALGGGVVGDITGFCAASWLRGVDFAQIPTTLLAQVDSSVGGKTGVNIPGGKNLVGAFKQPIAVICDTDTLSTLPPDIFAGGMGEVIKHAAIKSSELFDTLINGDIHTVLDDVVQKNIAIKSRVVEADEFEQGERMLLNFGHTLGHSIEKTQRYSGLSHGMAISAGMAMLTKQSEKAGLTKSGTYSRLCQCLQRHNLPVDVDIPIKTLITNSASDKKRADDSINLVLLQEIGNSYIKPFTMAEFAELLVL